MCVQINGYRRVVHSVVGYRALPKIAMRNWSTSAINSLMNFSVSSGEPCTVSTPRSANRFLTDSALWLC